MTTTTSMAIIATVAVLAMLGVVIGASSSNYPKTTSRIRWLY